MILGRIFEVAVLYQLGIESSIGGIADVLEEDANELVANAFLFGEVHAQRAFYGGGEVGQVLRVVVHALVAQLPVACRLGEVLLKSNDKVVAYTEGVAFLQPTGDGGRVAQPGHVVNL